MERQGRVLRGLHALGLPDVFVASCCVDGFEERACTRQDTFKTCLLVLACM